ncbi:hypothetical protein B0181_10440 [Moraxella caviae]|uniref:Probable periplasmic serine endoprotease DegP-like n=1 Tax=Moraxella caviae TaxID=34060 RepID=A0A1S9ZUY3_9GAMM|nr:trypsin-like peptidase domain-containing protein [Moraxella caviae]OOR87308.1 hypothetical protein B0181_10440 [Moraxella caviae]STZ14629.1 Probable periplasmic serine endoprotease DegP-like precursor [Moraxella caviae]VEW11398.1 Probable periplasmic serine endoprotease DegP-like precursor [Moraxella caviae]
MNTKFSKNFKSAPKTQRGISAWTIFPWLIAGVLAVALWWLFTQMQAMQAAGQNEAAITETPSEQVWQPAIAEPSAPAVSSYHDAVSTAARSVVNIYTTQTVQNPYANDPVLRQFFEYYGQQIPEQEQGASSLGSGVVVSKDGYIVTNAHVIDKADEIIVALNDGRRAHATVIGKDTETDLAVIKVEMENLVPLAFRKSPIRVGDVALAIGNPFGVGQTVTQGIISATGRTGLGVTTFEDFIQTDAAINPGNSGGALVDANGALIGINTVIYSRSGGSMGIGFAIPTSIVEQVMNSIIATGKVSRGWLGVQIENAAHNPANLSNKTGVTIAAVMSNGPAAQAGLQAGDVVTALDGTATNDAATFMSIIGRKAPNSSVRADVVRDGETLQLDVVLGERPSANANANAQSRQGSQNTNPNASPNPHINPHDETQLNYLLEQLEQLHRMYRER